MSSGADRATARTGKRVLLLVVAALVSAAAALAIGILLFGDFGTTEGRILATTALLAGYAVLALPAAILLDQRRLRGLAAAVVVLSVAGASLSTYGIWSGGASEAVGKAMGTATGWLILAAQVSVLAARQRDRDPRLVRRLFALSSVSAFAVGAMFSAFLWAEIGREGYIRVFGALVVLDAVLVALQPILARARPTATVHRLRALVGPEVTVELSVEAPDLAAAASKAIRLLEHDGRRVLLLEFVDRAADRNSNGAVAAYLPTPRIGGGTDAVRTARMDDVGDGPRREVNT